MPLPEAGEEKEHFISRCIPQEITDGAAEDEKQAAAICYSKWDKHIAASLDVCLSAPSSPAQPITKKFRKEIIKIGKYVKDGKSFTVDKPLLQHWVDTFTKMKFAGVKIPVPVGHPMDYTKSVENNRGWVREIEFNNSGDGLDSIIEAIGSDAEDTADLIARNDVSIYSPAEYIDGKGTKFTRPILHVGLTTTPVVGGMAEAIAASQTTSGQILPVEVLELEIKDQPMAEETIKIEESANKIRDFDPQILKLSIDNTALRLNQLVQAGSITPNVSNKLKALVSEDYIMSQKLDISQIVDILAENSVDDIVRIKPQAVALDKVAATQAEDYASWVERKYASKK